MKKYIFSKEKLANDLKKLGKTEKEINDSLVSYGNKMDNEEVIFENECEEWGYSLITSEGLYHKDWCIEVEQ